MAQEALSQEELQTMRQLRSEGSTLEAISEATGRSVGAVSHAVRGIKKPTKPKVKAEVPAAAKPGTTIASEGVLPGAYEKFKQIGSELGVKEPLLGSYADYVFQLGGDNINKVYEGLHGLGLRHDIVQRWTRLYGGFLGQPLPQLGEAGNIAAVKKFSVVNDEIMPDEEGDYTFTQALRLLSTKTGGGDDTKALLVGIYKKLTEGETGGLAALKDEVRQLREDRSRTEIAAVMTSVQGLRAELVAIKSEQGAKGEFDIMGQGLSLLDRRLGSIESGIMARWSIPPGPMSEESRKELTQAISTQSQEEQALDDLAEVVFYGGKGSAERSVLPKQRVVPQPPATYA
ncbi:hypothetical protein ES705_08813 [subsurface metagenome]